MPHFAILVVTSLLWALTIAGAPPAQAHGVRTRTIEIVHPWTFGTPTAGGDIEVSLGIKNIGRRPDRLLGVETPLAGAARLVETQAAGTAKSAMPILIAPGGRIELVRSGIHVRLERFAKAQSPYDTFPLTLVFERAGRIVVEVLVEERAN